MIKELMTMRDFSKLFQTGNLTPKERVLILIADAVSKESKGKGFLSKADITGLQNWTPKDNNEVNEYNKYQSAYKLYLYMELDAKLQYKDAEISEARIAILTKDFNFYDIYTHALAELDWGETKNAKGEVIDDKALLIGGGLGFRDELKGFLLNSIKDLVKSFSIIDKTGENETITFKDKEFKELYLRHKNNFIWHYQILLAYNDIFKDFSSLFDVDMTYKTKEYITACKDAITMINDTITGDEHNINNKDNKQEIKTTIGGKDADLTEKITGARLKRRKETMTKRLDKDLIIDTDKIKPNTEYFKAYHKDLNELFGDKYK